MPIRCSVQQLSGKVAVITGAASGIGRALAVQLAEHGSHLAIADIDQVGLDETKSMLASSGVSCTTHIVDVADRLAVEAFAKDVVTAHDAVHVVINNAGVTLIELAEHVSYDDFEWVMQINFWGVVYGSKAFLPYLRLQDEAHIVNVSSLFGLMALPLQSAYNASKFAVRGFTEALKMELCASPVRVSCVHPGGINTAITKNSRVGDDALAVSKEELEATFEAKALTTPDKAARIIIRGILKNKRRILVGPDARIADWVVRHFPSTYEKWLGIEREVKKRVAERQKLES